ncbi:MAG TPA: winged helix-turn-helix domain-containing protein [Candidatus Methanoperedens sp.]|nr:winged helix-turn-helix domain-containing protein [Candidatus Methanoperedens sp.]HLB69666.1 winged helix-turn-helix domain-containing protein [Candidatus Methanoperedens sp.]
MGISSNKKIEEYAKEMPWELRRAIEALNDDLRLAVFFVLLKHGELSFSQIMAELEIPRKDSSILSHHLKILEKGALIKNEFAKKEGMDSHSFYDLTEFGEDVLNGLMDTLAVPRLAGEPIEPLKKLLYQVGSTVSEKAFKEATK